MSELEITIGKTSIAAASNLLHASACVARRLCISLHVIPPPPGHAQVNELEITTDKTSIAAADNTSHASTCIAF